MNVNNRSNLSWQTDFAVCRPNIEPKNAYGIQNGEGANKGGVTN